MALTMSWVVWLSPICVLPKVPLKTEDSILQAISDLMGLKLYGWLLSPSLSGNGLAVCCLDVCCCKEIRSQNKQFLLEAWQLVCPGLSGYGEAVCRQASAKS